MHLRYQLIFSAPRSPSVWRSSILGKVDGPTRVATIVGQIVAWGYSTWDFQEQWILHPLVTRLSGARKAIRRSGRILGPLFKLCTLELEGPDFQKIRLLCGMCWEKVVDRSIPPRSSAFDAFDNHAAVLTASHAENSEKEQQFPRGVIVTPNKS